VAGIGQNNEIAVAKNVERGRQLIGRSKGRVRLSGFAAAWQKHPEQSC
jgi:hypothetical protein